ncbi:MAG: hypothetical protein ISQ34_04930 [Rickettsiales bacterium]|nr:hypothetical protein [Rickettsiales bacterium]
MKDSFLFQKSFYRGCVICIQESFILASKGKEEIGILLWRWGLLSYLITYLVFYKLIGLIGFGFLSGVIAFLVISFYLWHIVVIFRCRPKKKKLDKATKRQQKLIKSGSVAKSFARKLFLQEPWLKTQNSTFILVIDLLIIVTFLEYLV